MSRPHDWHVLDLPDDPTPGEPYSIRALARSAGTVADDAQQAHSAVRALAGDGAVLSWIGAAGEVFRGALHDFPSQLDKLHHSYEQAAGALSRWAGLLEDAQHQADRALAQGRQARAEIDALTAQLSAARADASRAATTSRRLSDVPAGGPPPDPAQVRAATAAASAAGSRVAGLDSALSDAHARLHAATRLAQQARELRKDGARRTRHELDDASDAGIQPKSRWQKFKDAVAKAWHITVQIATVVAIVVAVVALFVGGPIVWGILLAASAVLLADSLLTYANGEGSLWDVGLAALGVIPGGKLLTGLGKIIGTVKAGEHVLAAGARGLTAARAALRGAATGLRSGAGRVLTVGARAGSADAAAAARLTGAQRAAVDAFLAKAAGVEERLTGTMHRITDSLPGTRLAGLEFRLKGGDSLARKVVTEMDRDPLLSAERALSGVNDAVRYTVVVDDVHYARDASAALQHLRDEGFELVKAPKNGWGSDGYQGLNSTWRDPHTGQTFEVQAHTPSSLAAKEHAHQLYEEQRVLAPSDPRFAELEAQMSKIFGDVPRPPGASGVHVPPRPQGVSP